MMNEHPYFHWDLLRQPLQTPQYGMAPSFFDVNSILELRKEKSRDAARSRRGKENYEFYELAKLLPLPAAITSQLDKASIIRLTISYLKLRNFSCYGEPQWSQDSSSIGSIGNSNKNGKVLPGHRRMEILDPFESRQGTHILQSLDGFAFILANDGRFLYISETVSIYLGLSQVEMAGSSIFDYVHHDDHCQLTEYLGMCSVPAPGPANTPPSSGSDDAASPGQRSQTPSEKVYIMVNQREKCIHKSFSIRMKSTLTKRGAHVKTSGYRVLHILGTLRPQSVFGLGQGNSQSGGTTGGGSNHADTPPMGLVGMAIALPPPTISELRLEMDTFILRLNPDFKIVYCDPPLSNLMDLTPEDVTDRLLYDLCHAADLKLLQQAHSDIISKGQVLSDYWRMLNRHGGYTWVQTYATTLFNNKTPEEQTILAINYVISGARNPGSCVDLWQVTGDVSASMSSAYVCPVRDQLLKGLQKKEIKKGEKPATASSQNKSHDKPVPNQKLHEDGNTVKLNLDLNEGGNDETSPNGSRTGNQQEMPTTPIASSMGKENEISTAFNTGNMTCDGKNNRRKMDNPRKRKKSEEDSDSLLIPGKSQNICTAADPISKTSQCSSMDFNPISTGNTTQLDTPIAAATNLTQHKNTNVLCPSPEDLSLKKALSTPEGIDNLHRGSLDNRLGQNDAGVIMHHHQNSPKINTNRKQMTSSSVHDLEAAMNRHLPRQELNCKTSSRESDVSRNFDTNVTSTTATTKAVSIPPYTAQCGQWIPPSLRTPPATAGDILPTSNLLRCLYTTRESVIKTHTRPQNNNTTYLNGETPSSLLTPPEPESSETLSSRELQNGKQTSGFDQTHLQHQDSNFHSFKGSDYSLRDSVYKDNPIKDQFHFFQYKDHLSSAYIDHFASGSGYKDHIASAYKDFSQFKDIVPAFSIPNLVSPGDRFQQNYPSLPHPFTLPVTSTHHENVSADPCSITPPASNSPDGVTKTSHNNPRHHHSHHQQQSQNNHNNHQIPHHHSNAFDNSSSSYPTDVIGNSFHNHLSNKHFTPIQFHAHPSTSSPNNSYHHYRHQDYTTSPFHHNQELSKAGYYGMTSSPVASMYMDLTNSTATQYEACHRPTLTWY